MQQIPQSKSLKIFINTVLPIWLKSDAYITYFWATSRASTMEKLFFFFQFSSVFHIAMETQFQFIFWRGMTFHFPCFLCSCIICFAISYCLFYVLRFLSALYVIFCTCRPWNPVTRHYVCQCGSETITARKLYSVIIVVFSTSSHSFLSVCDSGQAEEAQEQYRSCMADAGVRKMDLANAKSTILTQIRELVFQCDLTLKAVSWESVQSISQFLTFSQREYSQICSFLS